MTEWQPIETAPKDGTRVLVYGRLAGELYGPHEADTWAVAMWKGGSTDYPGFNWSVPGPDYMALWVRPLVWQPLRAPALQSQPDKETEQ